MPKSKNNVAFNTAAGILMSGYGFRNRYKDQLEVTIQTQNMNQ